MAYKGFVVCWLWEVSLVNSALLFIINPVEELSPLDYLLDAAPSSWSYKNVAVTISY